MNDKTDVCILPNSKVLQLDQYRCGPMVEACNWSENTEKYVESLGFTGALYEFKTWDQACKWANDHLPKGWTVEYSSPDGDLDAELALEDF